MDTTVKNYYDYNMPREEAIISQELWSSVATTTVTIQPSGTEAIFLGYIKLLVTKTFAMTNTDTITITINAYDNVAPQTIVLTSAASIPEDLMELISLGDPSLYKEVDVDGTVKAHQIGIKFKAPIYLRSSPSVADSVTIVYAGGGVTAGSMRIVTESWKVSDEDNTGIYTS